MYDEPFFTIPEVAEKFRVSDSVIERAIKAGRLRAYKFGDRSFRIPQTALEALANEAVSK